MISLIVMIPSRICLPSTNPACSGDIRSRRRGLSLFAMVLVIILKMTLQRAIGQNLPGLSAPSSLGIKDKNVALRVDRTFHVRLEFSTMVHTSSLIVSQNSWKKLVVNPFGPGALPFSIYFTTSSSSYLSIGLSRTSFWASVIFLGMNLITFSMALSLSTPGSSNNSLKKVFSSCSKSS